jgi:hypothetical protein
MAWRKLVSIIKQTAQKEELKQFNNLAKMIQVGLIAYFSGGAFLSLSYFDLPWHLVSVVIILNHIINNQSLPINIDTLQFNHKKNNSKDTDWN